MHARCNILGMQAAITYPRLLLTAYLQNLNAAYGTL
jgi:hypothetical protein